IWDNIRFPKYGPAVDLWGMGSIMAELFTLLPLFPGSSSPTEFTWREGLERASKIRYQFPEVAGVNLSALIPSASKEAVNLIGALCSWDPSKRPTAVEALQHPFFQSCYYQAREPKYQPIGKYNTIGLMEKYGGVYDTAEKLAPMTIRSTRGMAPRQQEQQVYIPPPVNAGIRNGRSNLGVSKIST
nr:cyclin-dependent kinase F-4-like isoform X1 [Tanacetum cinerariifolium]